MAGLCAAARARELGARPVVVEKGTRAGGSMLLSSCVVWRHRSFEEFRRECHAGDPDLQQTILDRLDEGLEWLERLGAPVVAAETGNPLTTGRRFDPRGLTDALVEAAGDVRLDTPLREPGGALILATGGFQASTALVDEYVHPAGPLRLRSNPWSAGDGLRLGLGLGGGLSAGMDEFYGRNMPDCDLREEEFVPLAQLYGRHARVFNEQGEEFFRGAISWSENDLVQATARQPGALAWYVVGEHALDERVGERTVREMVETAPTRVDPGELPFPAPAEAVAAVRVRPAITHTIGGLRIDERARLLRPGGDPVDGVFACGADAGGIAAGGYASGLAAALVFGRIAAESALA